MKKIINEDSSISNILVKQYASAKVVNREFTGVGFFTNFRIDDKSLSLGNDVNLELGRIHAEIKGLKYGAGFILYIRSGMLAMLEGYSYGDDKWVKKITDYTLYLINPDGSMAEL